MHTILKMHRACGGRGCSGCDNGFIRVEVGSVLEIKSSEPQPPNLNLLKLAPQRQQKIGSGSEKNPTQQPQQFVNKPIGLLRLRR